ncbi:MAG: phenylalanine--tRNA ligase subunit alpha [Gemmatimonadetes bacterium]|nr:phenylalanine--tRNA ligase subunit alpha [Gemmatimonadota bacterium]
MAASGSPLQRQLDDIESYLPQIAAADSTFLTVLKVRLLGRKSGELTLVLRQLPQLAAEERRDLGAKANQLKARIEEAIAARERALAAEASQPSDVDGSMPARFLWRGALHPVTQVVDEICAIFGELGFTRITGPEAETEEYNFTKLNVPLDHPAVDALDTFYLGPGVLLRTHTSPMQARTMERYQPPIRVVVPGLAYRRDPWDPSHSPAFEQIEGLAVDEGVSFVDFKAAIDFFVKRFFTRDTTVRFRPSFFPFVEPGAEVDVQCQVCKGGGCSTCKRTGYLEIMGAGMVHPAVFERCGLDAERYTGYAFGMGPGRIAMLRYGIPDIRLLFESDMRFLGQFVE